jgi:hypothetical protein
MTLALADGDHTLPATAPGPLNEMLLAFPGA